MTGTGVLQDSQKESLILLISESLSVCECASVRARVYFVCVNVCMHVRAWCMEVFTRERMGKVLVLCTKTLCFTTGSRPTLFASRRTLWPCSMHPGVSQTQVAGGMGMAAGWAALSLIKSLPSKQYIARSTPRWSPSQAAISPWRSLGLSVGRSSLGVSPRVHGAVSFSPPWLCLVVPLSSRQVNDLANHASA